MVLTSQLFRTQKALSFKPLFLPFTPFLHIFFLCSLSLPPDDLFILVQSSILRLLKDDLCPPPIPSYVSFLKSHVT